MTADSNGEQSGSASSILYRKLRSPKSDGESLQVPLLGDVDKVWQSNLARVADSDSKEIAGHPLSELRELGRRELVNLALGYSQKYLDVDFSNRSTDHVILAGHQPELFHSGVWYKNFVLSKLGRQFNCVAVNLVVDNDICGNASIRFPNAPRDASSGVDWKRVAIGTIPIAQPGPNVPFEVRQIEDLDFFEAFAKRAAGAIEPLVDQPIVNQLWRHVLLAGQTVSSDDKPKLGASIAAGRHKLESEHGLESLEVPLSLVSGTRAFATFTLSILKELERFQSVYNDTLMAYRVVHRIRSRSHPVPELESVDGWIESPFWIWKTDQPERKRLFAKHTGNQIVLTDRDGWVETFEVANFVDQFSNLHSRSSVAIRPKALMTTMYSRLVLSDLFLHGIGGSKYDQLTDAISEKFFAVALPNYYTLSATLKLPCRDQLINPHDVVAIEQRLRQLEFHPETLMDSPDAQALSLVEQKRSLIAHHQSPGKTKANHDAIVAINQQLRGLADINASGLEKTVLDYRARLRASEILGSREYSFCLFNEALIGKLKALAS